MGSWLERFFGKSSKPATAASNDIPGEPVIDLEEEMRGYARNEVGGGYSDREAAIQLCVEVLSDDADLEVLEPMAERLVDEALAEHARESATWPETTDCDRLDIAFVSLEQAGIVARQNFSCCGTCGSGEIWDEIAVADATSGSTRGYTFFHQQDTEHAVDGFGLYLNYGACAEGESAAVAIGHEIVDHLGRAGLRTNWDGDLRRRIGVELDWKRRRMN